MPLVFDTFQNAPPASTATYYAHALTAAPSGSEATVSALSLASPSGYAPLDLTVTTVLNGTITNWDFVDAVWSALNWTTNLYGTAVVLQVGASKNAAVDRPFLFYEFENGLHAPIVLTPGYFALRFSTGVDYALATQAANKYDIGGFVGYPFYKDLITLLASNNGNRYTPVSALTASQFSSATYANNLNHSFLSYWVGDRAMVKELQGRHNLGYNNVTFPLLGSPVLSFNSAATFNGIDSYVTIGNTSTNGADFTFRSDSDNYQQLVIFYFQPTLSNTEEVLLDTTTSNNSGGVVIRKTASDRIEILYLTAGTPHTAAIAASNGMPLNIGQWNLVLYGSYGNVRRIWVNDNATTLAGYANLFTSPTLTNGIRLGARRGLNAALTGANFTGKLLYFASALAPIPDGGAAMPAIANRNSQAPYNPAFNLGWSITGANTNTEMTTPNNFPADKNVFIRSIGNLDTYVGAQNLAANGTVLSQVRIDQPDCFYINFGQNKVKPGSIALIFPLTNTLAAIKLDTAANSAVFSVWGTNTLPGNIPTNANLINPLLWDKYDFTISGIANSGTLTDISGLTLTTSGGYRYYLLNTSITKYYKYLRLGWKNAVANASGGGSTALYAHYLLYNSSVLSANVDLVPPTSGYSA